MTYMEVARALTLQESRVLRCYARAGKVLVAPSGPLLEQALVLVGDVRKLAEFEAHLLPNAKAPAQAVA